METTSDVYYDPYDVAIDADPYPVFRRLREEAPLYYNEPHDFYALAGSRTSSVPCSIRRPSFPGAAESSNSSGPTSRCRPAC